MPNVVFRPKPKLSSYRKIAGVAWDAPTDPHVYGSLEVRSEPLEAWLRARREATGERVTVTHAVARALAMVLAKHPELNAFIRFGELALRRDVDIFVQVVVEDHENVGNADLSGVKVSRCDTLDVVGISRFVTDRARRIRARQDAEFEQVKSSMDRMPGLVVRYLLRFLQFVQYTLNLNPRALGAPADPFGSAMVTNVGVFGLTRAWAPFFPPARASMIITLGAIEEKPVVEDGRIVVGRVLHLNGTFDHRVVDGFHAGVVAREIRALLEHPERLDLPTP